MVRRFSSVLCPPDSESICSLANQSTISFKNIHNGISTWDMKNDISSEIAMLLSESIHNMILTKNMKNDIPSDMLSYK